MDETYKLALMLRGALEEAYDAMQAFFDPDGNPPENTGEFRGLKLAIESAHKALSAGTIKDVEQIEADNQRARQIYLPDSGRCARGADRSRQPTCKG